MRDGLDLSINARSDLMERTREKDDISFGSKEGVSRQTNFSASTVRSTSQSLNIAQFTRAHKGQPVDNVHLARDNAEMKKREMYMMEQMRALEATIAQIGAPPIAEALQPVK